MGRGNCLGKVWKFLEDEALLENLPGNSHLVTS